MSMPSLELSGRRSVRHRETKRRKGTFTRKHEAHRAIDEAYGLSGRPDSLGDYAATWTDRHPRAGCTKRQVRPPNQPSPRRGGRGPPAQGPATARVAPPPHPRLGSITMLRNEGRAITGTVGMLRALSAMAEDAITDEVCDLNPFKGIRIRANDPRARKKSPARSASSASRRGTASQGQPAATRQWSCLHRHRPETGGGPAPAPRRLRRRNAPSPPHRPREQGSSREPRPTTASPTPAESSRYPRPSPG